VENGNVLDLLATAYLKGMGYLYRVILKEPGNAVTTAFLSRLPVLDVASHRISDGRTTGLRCILEVRFDTGSGNLLVLNNHWKSKLGGEEETEGARLLASSVVARRIREVAAEEPDLPVVVLGDFNEDLQECLRQGSRYRTALMCLETGETGSLPLPAGSPPSLDLESLWLTGDLRKEGGMDSEKVVLFSPWFAADSGGSYSYRGEWERIDHFMLNGCLFDGRGLEYGEFSVVEEPPLLREDGSPRSWDPRTGRGFSDHLPLLLVLEKAGSQ